MKLLKFFLPLPLFIGLWLPSSAVASPKLKLLNTTISKYRSAAVVEMTVQKILKSELLDKKSSSEGKIYLSKEKFRFDIDSPEKSQIIFDGETIWSIQHPPAELPGPVQIAKSKLGKNTQKQILISTLFSPGGIKKNFKITNMSETTLVEKFAFVPLTKELSLKLLKMSISKKDKVIEEMSYIDDVGNETILDFKSTRFNTQAQKKLFQYTPPKGAQVTNL
jgi:outer membrane lipoprotein carrier protein